MLGKTVKVKWLPLEGSVGDCDVNTLTITLDPSQPADSVWPTFLHELFHMALGITGHSYGMKEKEEEAIVRGLESAFSPLVKLR